MLGIMVIEVIDDGEKVEKRSRLDFGGRCQDYIRGNQTMLKKPMLGTSMMMIEVINVGDKNKLFSINNVVVHVQQ